MNPWLRRVLQSFPRALNIGLTGACQSGNDGPAHRNRNRLHGLEVSIRSDGKTSFDHVHAETVKLISQAQLFLLIHGATGRLLSVAKSRVENRDACGHGSPLKTQLVISYGATVAEVKLIILLKSLVLVI